MGQHIQQLTETTTSKSASLKIAYSALLGDTMKAMQGHLEAMNPPIGRKYEAYLKTVHEIAADIKCHGADICHLPRFFLVSSSHYQPLEADPEFYRQGILNYCRRFSSQRERTSSELFHYLHGGWKKAFVGGKQTTLQHAYHLNKAMKNLDFMNFVLGELLPAILQTSFTHMWSRASMIHIAYLKSLPYRVGQLLNGNETDARHCFRQVINVLRVIMNCLLARAEYSIMPMFWLPDLGERTIRTMACHFWLKVTPYLKNHVHRFRHTRPEDEHLLQELNRPFLHYLECMSKCMDVPYDSRTDWMIPLWPIEEGRYSAYFKKFLEDDVKDFRIESGKAAIKMGRDIHWVDLSIHDMWMPSFERVLQYGHIERHAPIPEDEDDFITNFVS
jgi:hypothetical protein